MSDTDPRTKRPGEWSAEERFAVAELAHLLLTEGQRDSARALLEGLVEVAPDDLWSRMALAASLRALKLYDGAARQLDEALRIDPQNLAAAVELGEVNLLRGQMQAARGCSAMAEYMLSQGGAPEALKVRVQRLARVTATSS